jgi:hypothetical protein
LEEYIWAAEEITEHLQYRPVKLYQYPGAAGLPRRPRQTASHVHSSMLCKKIDAHLHFYRESPY